MIGLREKKCAAIFKGLIKWALRRFLRVRSLRACTNTLTIN
jgi:hypothetical protein